MSNMSNDDMVLPIQAPGENRPYPVEGVVPATSPLAKGQTTQKTLKRPFNPLSSFSSYNYQLSLYMLTPDGYDIFLQNNRKGIENLIQGENPKAFQLIQSGGINRTVNQRPLEAGFQYDYYIDNLKLDTAVAPSSTGTSAALYDISFDIIEPLGFAFATELLNAAKYIEENSATRGVRSQSNPTRQNFVLGIRFFGYDANGEIINESKGAFEKFYEFIITDMTTRLNGRNCTYHITGAGTSLQVGYGLSRGTIKKGAMVKGSTIQDLLEGDNPSSGKLGLLTKLNIDEETSGAKEFNRYKVKFVGPDADLIKKAVISSKEDIEKSRALMAKAKTTVSVNEALSQNAVPDFVNKSVTFKNDTPILQAIQQLILQSTYITNGLNTVYTNALQADPNSNQVKTETPTDQGRPLRWYNVSVQASNPRFDPTTKRMAYDITYIIQSYKTPIVISPVANKTDLYYGPVKRYDYWYTGQNSEIIKYEQQFDNLYQMVSLNPNPEGNGTGGKASIGIDLGRATGGDKTGKLNQGLEAQNQLKTFLTDPSAFTDVTIDILGDPDYMFNPIPGNLDDLDTISNPYYGLDGYTINPNTGQVFIEVDFKQAVDYDDTTGVLSLNNKIIFWGTPPARYNVKGISYQIIDIKHFFRGGKFTQTLTCTINVFDDPVENTDGLRSDENQTETEVTRLKRSGTGTTSDLKQAPPPPLRDTVSLLSKYPKPVEQAPNDDQFINVDPMGNYRGY